jgi:lipopolysaccharide/colanic/teichoic acid biosynthesis glycosyltransferase
MRRSIDILGSAMGLILLFPLFLFIRILIKRDSSGPLYYRGARVGKNGKEFNILKFRTMYESLESYAGPSITAADDTRITPIGHWLRETKLNELPQLWNVLKGEMSMVGPRPEVPEIVGTWPESIRNELLSVRPGVTSPASVLYRYEENLLQAESVMSTYLREILPSKLRLDLVYVRTRSIMTDLDVILWTVLVLLPQMKSKDVPEYLLYWGPLSRFISRYISWFLVDVIVAFTAVGVVGAIWRASGPLHIGFDLAAAIGIGIALLFSLINSAMGLNRVVWSKASAADALDLAFSTAVVTFLLLAANWLWKPADFLPIGMLIEIGLLAFIGFVSIRYRSRIVTGIASRWIRLRGKGLSVLGERVLIVGAGEAAKSATWLMRRGTLAKAFSLVGFVDDDPRKQGLRIDGLNVVGQTSDLPALAKKLDIGLLVFAISNIDPESRERIHSMAEQTGIRVISVPELLEIMSTEFRSDEELSDRRKSDDQLVLGSMSIQKMSDRLVELETLIDTGEMEASHAKLEEIRNSLAKHRKMPRSGSEHLLDEEQNLQSTRDAAVKRKIL